MHKNKIKMLVLSLTGNCNFACEYCYASEQNKETMTPEIAKKAIDLAAADGDAFTLQLSGGEPLLNFACIKEITKYVEEKNLPAILQIQTNGSLITDEIAKFLFEHKIAIGVSLDGRPGVNNKLRKFANGKGTTNAMLKGVEILKNNNIAMGVTCVVTDTNVRDLVSIVEMAYYLGNVRRIGFDLLRGQGRGVQLVPPEAEDVRVNVEETYRQAEKMQVALHLPIYFSQIERVKVLQKGGNYNFGHCYAMNGEAAFVDAKGDIYACSSLMGHKDFYLGNVDIGIDAQLRYNIKARICAAMHFCTACRDFKLCGGGCFARWYGTGQRTQYLGECALKRVSIAWATGTNDGDK
ncbi:MAG: radical SAM protein [Acidaminococcaceae bacterium]|nr:radical SAM protein [Acidaminococcaceae bacterium]